MFEVRDLKKYFPRVKAVDGISFSFEKGDVMGFIGPNGAGKTTTMRVMVGLDYPTAGECFVDGRSTAVNYEYLHRKVGFMPDYTGTFPNMTVHEYMDFFARAAGLHGRERRGRVERVEEFTGLDVLRDKQVEELSKGMKQRLGLGRVLVHDPDYLVLDEPAAGLDPRARIEVRELLKILGESGKGIFVSSHILSELAEICNKVAVIDKGKILCTGTVEEIRSTLQGETEIELGFLPSCDREELEKFLLTRPEASRVRVARGSADFIFGGKEEELPSFLRILFDRGFPLVEVKKKEMSMEELFMRITGGNETGEEKEDAGADS